MISVTTLSTPPQAKQIVSKPNCYIDNYITQLLYIKCTHRAVRHSVEVVELEATDCEDSYTVSIRYDQQFHTKRHHEKCACQ